MNFWFLFGYTTVVLVCAFLLMLRVEKLEDEIRVLRALKED